MMTNSVSPALNFGHWAGSFASQMSAHRNSVTGDLELAKRHIAQVTQGRSRFSATSLRGANAFAGAVTRVGRTTFHFFRWDCEAECQVTTARAADHNIVLFIPLSGSFQILQMDRSARVDPGELVLVSSGANTRRRWCGTSELLSVCITRNSLQHILSTDFPVEEQCQPLMFEPLTSVSCDRASTLLHIIETAVYDLNSATSVLSDPVIAEHLERTLIHVLLKSVPHSHSENMSRSSDPVPFYVKRAEAFIHGHLGEDLSIRGLSELSGVSMRTLYYGFKKYRSLSPIKYIKKARLMWAHDLLRNARLHGGRIADIAARTGYNSHSQFSRDYKNHFGISPLSMMAPQRASRG